MNVTDPQTRGYPLLADILDQAESLGLEGIDLGNTNFIESHWKMMWGLINAARWSMSLGVYAATSTTFNVRGGNYVWDNTIKTFTPGAAVNPTDNDTTYIWMAADNTIGSAIDGTGWTTDPHIKLAEIDVDSDGVITAVRDLRDKTFLRRFPDVPTGAIVGISDTQTLTNKTIDGDSNTVQDLPITAIKTDLPNASKFLARDASGIPVSGKAVPSGDVVGNSDTQTLTNKTIDSDSNTITDIAPDDLKVLTGNIAVPFIITATLTAGSTVAVFTANAPYKFRVINAWSIAKSADAGTWKLTDGTNDITNAVAVTATDKTVNAVGTIDDVEYEIAANGSLSVVGDGSLADVEVYIECIKVS